MEDRTLPAGDFSAWLSHLCQSQKTGRYDNQVPCGTCTACCTSSLFIHIKPEEQETLTRIPKALLFPAPGLPKGHVLLGYDKNGRCPMFREGQCSIYEFRPETCREFDCRIFAATKVEMNFAAHAAIVEQAKRWRFEMTENHSRDEQDAVLAAASFLREKAHLFPVGALPQNQTQLALLAIKVHHAFLDGGKFTDQSGAKEDKQVVGTIMDILNAPHGP